MDDSDGSGLAWLIFAIGPGTGIAIWSWIQAKYRNKNARYKPEATVDHSVTHTAADDQFVRKITSGSRHMSGRNESKHHQRAAYHRVVKS